MNATIGSSPDFVIQSNASDDMEQFYLEIVRIGQILNVACPVIFALLFLVGTVGNILVVYVTLSPTSNRFTTRPLHSVLVLNLAAADLIYLFCSLPYQAVKFSVPGWIYGATLCPLLHFLSVWTMGVGIFTMCSLAFMRFVGLVFPFRFKNSFLNSSSGISRLCLALTLWLSGAILASPNLLYFQIISEPQEHCTWPNRDSHDVYWAILVTCTYVIPFLMVSILYILIAVQVICFMKKKDSRPSQAQPDQESYNKLTAMVTILITAFLLCWLPYHVYTVIQVTGFFIDPQYAIKMTILELLGYCCSYMHACINPIIYTFAAPEFRRSLWASLSGHNLTSTGPCSWKRSSPRRSCSQHDAQQTKTTNVNSEALPKMSTSVYLEMSKLPQAPMPKKT